MSLTYHVSRARLETALYNSLFQKAICLSDPLLNSPQLKLWMSGMALKTVKIRSGTTASEMQNKDIWGAVDTQGKVTVKRTFTVPKLYADLEYELKTLNDKDLLAAGYEKETTHLVTLRMHLTADLSVDGEPMICLSYDSVEPKILPGTSNVDLDYVFKFKFPFNAGNWLLLPGQYLVPRRIPGLVEINVGYRLSTDELALVVHGDFEYPKAVAATGAIFEIPFWKDFYTATLTSQLKGKDVWVSYDASVLRKETMHRAQQFANSIQDFSLDSIDVSWGATVFNLLKTGTTSVLVATTFAEQGMNIEGEVPNACLWIDVNFYIKSSQSMRMLHDWEQDFQPGRLLLTKNVTSGTTGTGGLEVVVCRTLQVLASIGGLALGGLAFSWPGAIAGLAVTAALVDKDTKVDDWSVNGTSKWYVDLVHLKSPLGKTVATEMVATNETLEFRYDGDVKSLSGSARIEVTVGSMWYYASNACRMAPRNRPQKSITIKNTGTATLYVCRLELEGSDPENVYISKANSLYWIGAGESETFSIVANVQDKYEANPYGIKLRLISNAGPRIVDIGIATRLSQTDYDTLCKNFYIDPRECFNLEKWPDKPWIRDIFGPVDPPWRRDPPTIVHYELFVSGLDPARCFSISTTGTAQLGQFFPVEGVAHGFIGLAPEAAESAFIELSAAATDREAQKSSLVIWRFDWHLEDSWESPVPMRKLGMFGGRVLALTEDQLFAFNDSPMAMQRDWGSISGHILDFAVLGSKLYLLRPSTIDVHTVDHQGNLVSDRTFSHAGYARLCSADGFLVGTSDHKIEVLQLNSGLDPQPVMQIGITGALDAVAVGEALVIHTAEGLVMHDLSEDDPNQPLDFWSDESITSIRRVGRLIVAASKSRQTLLNVTGQRFHKVASYAADARPLLALRSGAYGYALKDDGLQLQSFRVIERTRSMPINVEEEKAQME
jgi:hypothetical protein